MSYLLSKNSGADENGCTQKITPASANWKYVGFELFELAVGKTYSSQSGDNEICLVTVTGTANIIVDGKIFEAVGKRETVFADEAPGAVYLSSGSSYSVIAISPVTLAICSAPGKGTHKARQITSKDMGRETRGSGNNIRHVRNILPETEPADSLLVVEVITPSGNWSSYPPHKHDSDNLPVESSLEETYYHRVNPSQGFAFQRVYTDDRSIDETMTVEDGDVVMVPRGYHPVGTPHGYDLYYLNVMAGPTREWHFNNDPAHEWIVT